MAGVEHFDIGDRVTFRGTFQMTADDSLFDPADVTARLRSPSAIATIDAGDVTHPSTGVYEFQRVVDASGVWTARFESVDGGAAAEFQIYVRPSAFP